MSRSQQRAIVLVVDRWGAAYAGPYGNTWLDTPACNQLANEAILFEQALVNGTSLASVYDRLWGLAGSGINIGSESGEATDLLTQLSAAGLRSRLISDDPEVLGHVGATRFDRAEAVEQPIVRRAARTPERTTIARLLASALATCQQSDPPDDLLWIHCRGMAGPWDAPVEYRLQFRDDEDPDPPLSVEPPSGPVPADVDPDTIQGWLWAYAGQVALLDWCLAPWIAYWQELDPSARPLLVVMGARGYALGEHAHWGDSAQRLYSELLHVPLFVASGRVEESRLRCQSLVEPAHLKATLCRWLLGESVSSPLGLLECAAGEPAATGFDWPQVVAAAAGSERALRSPAWHCCFTDTGGERSLDAATSELGPTNWQLYLKPDDRWEVNDVADRCPEVVSAFAALYKQLRQVADADSSSIVSAVSLAPELMRGPD